MNAEIITIGDEILIGQTVDTNSSFIARELNKIGISVRQFTTIQDERLHITEALRKAATRVDIVLTTGGLGPTKDDVTKYTFSEFFEDRLVLDQGVLSHIEELFTRLGRTMSDLNREQAMVPSRATALHNKYGTAPGIWMEREGKVFISLPGVPYEMKNLMEQEVIPRLQQKFKRPFIYHKTILTRGAGESDIANRLAAWEDQLPSHLKLAYLPDLDSVRIRISGKGDHEQDLIKSIEQQAEQVYELLRDVVRVEQEEDENIVVQISQLLVQRSQFLSTAESCTGGALAASFTTHPGASACFRGGVITYATPTKTQFLEVPQDLIEKHSVVSAEVVEAMARGAKKKFRTDYALATTGNAGPTKGDSNAEVGTVFIGLATPQGVISREFLFGPERDQVVSSTVHKAFELILGELTGK